MLDRPSADVESGGDSRVGESFGEEVEDVLFPRGQCAVGAGAAVAADAEVSEQAERGVDVVPGTQSAEAFKGGPGFEHGHRGVLGGQCGREVEPDARLFEGKTEPAERADGGFEVAGGLGGVRGGGEQTSSVCRQSGEQRGRIRTGGLSESIRCDDGRLAVIAAELGSNEQKEQGRVEFVGAVCPHVTLRASGGEVGLTASQMQLDLRADGVGVVFAAVE